MAGNAYKQNPWSILLTDQKRNERDIRNGIITGFPSEVQRIGLASLKNTCMIGEVNFKEFMIFFKFTDTMRLREIPMSIHSVSLVDLMTYLARVDLYIGYPKQFLTFAQMANPMGGTSYNYPKAISWALQMEQKAIKRVHDQVAIDEHKLDMDKFKEYDKWLGGKADEDAKKAKEDGNAGL